MKTLFTGLALLAGCGPGFGPALVTVTNGVPSSGLIRQQSFTTWFDGTNTRHETHYQGQTSGIHVAGEKSWSAYPQCGRVVSNANVRFLPKSHPEETRRFFARMRGTNAAKLGEEVFHGFPCWKYVERSVQPTHRSDVAFDSTNIFLFLANADFPVLIRQGSPAGWNTNADVLGIKLDCPIDPGLFICPANFKSTRPFQIPAVPFEIELRQTRQSIRWGWSTEATNLLSSDGKSVTNRHVQTHRDAKGERQHGPITEIKPFQQGIIHVNYPMGPPYWGAVRKVGEDTVLGLKADVLDFPALDRRYWVVDHPKLGAFAAKWGMGGDTPETNEVLRLELKP